jgi:hypothetical protein
MTSATSSSPVHLYQIAYSEKTLAEVEPGYLVLDNLSNSRPDWYEYWAIRRHLLDEPLDEASFYGFFSPKFGRKTGLTHQQVTDFVQAHAEQADVVLFSPQPDMGAFFLNVFEQAETFDPGFSAAFGAFLEATGRSDGLKGLVMDSRQIVFSNYFVARPAFWREWLTLTEAMFGLCEGEDSPLRRQLTESTSYPGGAQRKVFLLERVASYLLTVQSRWRSKAANPFTMAWSMTRFRDHPQEAFVSDALKMAFREQGFPEYMQAFARVRDVFFKHK